MVPSVSSSQPVNKPKRNFNPAAHLAAQRPSSKRISEDEEVSLVRNLPNNPDSSSKMEDVD